MIENNIPSVPIVCDVARALRRILLLRPQHTFASIRNSKCIVQLLRAFEQYSKLNRKLDNPLKSPALNKLSFPREYYQLAMHLILAVIDYYLSSLDNQLHTLRLGPINKIMDPFFDLLDDEKSDPLFHRISIHHIAGFLRACPESSEQEYRLIGVPLFSLFCQEFVTIQQRNSSENYVLELLQIVCLSLTRVPTSASATSTALTSSPLSTGGSSASSNLPLSISAAVIGKESIQQLVYRDVDFMVHLVNHLSFYRSETIRAKTLLALRLLLTSSEMNKSLFRQRVREDAIISLLTDASHGVSDVVLGSMFNLIVEEEYVSVSSLSMKNSSAVNGSTPVAIQTTTSAQPRYCNDYAITLFLTLLRNSKNLMLQSRWLKLMQSTMGSTRSHSYCVQAAVFSSLINWVISINNSDDYNEKNNPSQNLSELKAIVTKQLISIMTTIGRYSMNVPELRHIFRLLQPPQQLLPNLNAAGAIAFASSTSTTGSSSALSSLPLAYDVVDAIRTMALRDGPSMFFDFNGVSSALLVPYLPLLPHKGGFTFMAWVRAESFFDPSGTPG